MRLKGIKLSDIYYILVALAYVTSLLIGAFGTDVFASVLMLLIFAAFIYGYVIKGGGSVRSLHFVDHVVIAYSVYALLSLIWLLGAGYPASVFAEEFSHSVLPVIFYFTAMAGYGRRDDFYRSFLIAIIISGAAVIILAKTDVLSVREAVYYLMGEEYPDRHLERSIQWVSASNNMYSTWLGNGLGANGHGVYGIEGGHVITEGGLVKLFCELGVIGFSLFIYTPFYLCLKNLKNFKALYTEYLIAGLMLISSVFFNSTAFLFFTPVFWYSLGIMRRKLKLNGPYEEEA